LHKIIRRLFAFTIKELIMGLAKDLRTKSRTARSPSLTDARKQEFVQLITPAAESGSLYIWLQENEHRDLYRAMSTAEGIAYLLNEGFYVEQNMGYLVIWFDHASINEEDFGGEQPTQPVTPDTTQEPIIEHPTSGPAETPAPPETEVPEDSTPIHVQPPAVEEPPVIDVVTSNPAPIDQPIEQPAAPIEEPAAPVEEPAAPVVEEPAAPIEQPVEQPLEEPAAPIEQPVVEQPAPVVEEPAAPIEQPAAPIEQPVVEQPAAPAEEPVPPELSEQPADNGNIIPPPVEVTTDTSATDVAPVTDATGNAVDPVVIESTEAPVIEAPDVPNSETDLGNITSEENTTPEITTEAPAEEVAQPEISLEPGTLGEVLNPETNEVEEAVVNNQGGVETIDQTSVVDNGDGTSTVTLEDGTTVTVANEVTPVIVDNGDSTGNVINDETGLPLTEEEVTADPSVVTAEEGLPILDPSEVSGGEPTETETQTIEEAAPAAASRAKSALKKPTKRK
jgi:hypothetical protein